MKMPKTAGEGEDDLRSRDRVQEPIKACIQSALQLSGTIAILCFNGL
ncbi:hypothetical protein [Phormidium sp. CCY1219]|nr:hypothetical protein [Phormidium sp. CCY1219]MEB3827877.1 hypothetical protein [Phormidium sp. CCY1219]